MFLLNSRLGLFSATTFVAPLFPKLRGHFAEFLNKGYLAHLRILSSPTCVGLRYGYLVSFLAVFLASVDLAASILVFCPHHSSALQWSVLHYPTSLTAWTGSTISPLCLSYCVTASVNRSKVVQEYQPVVHRLRRYCPRLRSRLTLGGRAFPRKP